MSAARAHRECQRLERWLMAYLDGELEVAHVIEVDQHLERCPRCREQLATLQATRISLARVLAAPAPASLRARVSQTLLEARAGDSVSSAPSTMAAQRLQDCDEARAGDSVSSAPPSSASRAGGAAATRTQAAAPLARARGSWGLGLRYVLPLAAAATLALVIGVLGLRVQPGSLLAGGASARPTVGPLSAAASLDGLIDDLVAQHANPPPPETTDPDGLARFDPYLGVRVRRPKFERVDARYVGARMQRRAALLQYVLRKRHRVSLLVFDSKKVPVRAHQLRQRHIGSRDVFVGRVRGFSVAASERNGIGYAMASDLDDNENAHLVLMAAR